MLRVPVPLIDPGDGVGEDEGDGMLSIIALLLGCEAQILSQMSMAVVATRGSSPRLVEAHEYRAEGSQGSQEFRTTWTLDSDNVLGHEAREFVTQGEFISY